MVKRGSKGERPKNVKDARNAKYARIVKDYKDAKGAKYAKIVKDSKDANIVKNIYIESAKDAKQEKSAKGTKSALDARNAEDSKSVLDAKSSKNSKSALDASSSKDAKSAWDVKNSKNDKNAKDKFVRLRVVAWLLLLTMIAGFSPSSERYSAKDNGRTDNLANSADEALTSKNTAGGEQKKLQVGRARTNLNTEYSDPRSEVSASTDSEKTAQTDANKVSSGEMYYLSDDIKVSIEKIQRDNITYFVADVKISDASQLKTAFAGGKYGKSYRTYTSKIAKNNDAIFAVNGDYHGFRDEGIIIRDGTIYRDKPSSKQLLVIDKSGDLVIKNEEDASAEELLEMDAVHTFSFGPTLVIDGKKAVPEKYFLSLRAKEPRTAIGQIDTLHYLFVTVDGRRKGYSDGVTISGLADIFLEYGCKTAYNLDGGGSATMVLNDKVINRVSGGGERSIGDIIYIGR